MSHRLILLGCVLVAAFCLIAIPFPDGPVAIGMVATVSLPILVLFRKYTAEKQFITSIFLGGLALRMGFGILIHIYDLRPFFWR